MKKALKVAFLASIIFCIPDSSAPSIHASSPSVTDDEKRQALWQALEKAWGEKFGKEKIDIDVYGENTSLTEVCFRSRNTTYLFDIQLGRIEAALHAKALPPKINNITFVESKTGDSGAFILWYYGQQELSIGTRK